MNPFNPSHRFRRGVHVPKALLSGAGLLMVIGLYVFWPNCSTVDSLLLFWVGVSLWGLTLGFFGGSSVVYLRGRDGRMPWLRVLVLAPLLVATWSYNAVRRAGVPDCNEIAPGLWLGDRRAARAHPWDAVIDMTCEYASPSSGSPGYVCMPWMDGTVIDPSFLERAAQLVDRGLQSRKQARVLVHCARGRWRSAQVVAYWLQTRFALTPGKAWRLLQERRPIVKVPAGL